MGQPFVGEIRMFAGNFPPNGWLFCDGQLLSIPENETLFQLIGTTYGGDGESTFALPNLQSRFPVHQGTLPGGQSYYPGEMAGMEEVTLTVQQIPVHLHPAQASTQAGTLTNPQGGLWAGSSLNGYATGVAPDTQMAVNAVRPTGGSQPHSNMPPYLGISFIISLYGVYPVFF